MPSSACSWVEMERHELTKRRNSTRKGRGNRGTRQRGPPLEAAERHNAQEPRPPRRLRRVGCGLRACRVRAGHWARVPRAPRPSACCPGASGRGLLAGISSRARMGEGTGEAGNSVTGGGGVGEQVCGLDPPGADWRHQPEHERWHRQDQGRVCRARWCSPCHALGG